MGELDPDCFRNRRNPKPQNPDWKKECARRYESTPQSARNEGVH